MRPPVWPPAWPLLLSSPALPALPACVPCVPASLPALPANVPALLQSRDGESRSALESRDGGHLQNLSGLSCLLSGKRLLGTVLCMYLRA